MTELRSEVIDELRQLTTILAEPFPSGAIEDGWCLESWTKWGHIFADLHEALIEGRPIPDTSFSRGLDFDGVVSGDILDRVAHMSISLKKLHQNASSA
jgi:hypothetical protein